MKLRMWMLLAFLTISGLAGSQVRGQSYNFTIPSKNCWPQWNCVSGAPHIKSYVFVPTGIMEVHGEGKKDWRENHEHMIWKTTDGVSTAQVIFSIGGPMKQGFINYYADHRMRWDWDCTANNWSYACYLGNFVYCVTVKDTGPTWYGMCMGDLRAVFSLDFPVGGHNLYLENGLVERLADGTLHLLDYEVVEGAVPIGQLDNRLSITIYQDAGAWKLVGFYREPNGTIHLRRGVALEPPDNTARVGLIGAVMKRHACMFNEAAWYFKNAVVIAENNSGKGGVN